MTTAERLGHFYKIRTRAVIAAQRQHRSARKIGGELIDIGWRSSPKSTDCLIFISHYPDIARLACQLTQQHTAGTVDILKLIDQNMLIELLLLLQDFWMLMK